MSTYPKISIVTPSFNQGKYLEETIRSLLDQEYPNLEYIIMDGGSTDDSPGIIKKYAPHLAYWTSNKDGGLYDAVNRGFARTTGEIMGWINSDDKHQERSLFKIAEIFKTFPRVEWLTGRSSSLDEQGKTFAVTDIEKCRWSKAQFYSLYLQQGFIQQESTFWRRGLWEKAGGRIRTDLNYAGDFELWLRFFRHAELYTCSQVLAGFRFRKKDQLSFDKKEEYLQEAIREYREQVGSNDKKELHLGRIYFFRWLAGKSVLPRFFSSLEKRMFRLPPVIDLDKATGKYYFRER